MREKNGKKGRGNREGGNGAKTLKGEMEKEENGGGRKNRRREGGQKRRREGK